MKAMKRAVALEYGFRDSPVLSAIGSGEVAERIIAEARLRGVYITSDPQLVSLLGQLELDQEIPEELYAAVAAVLSWAYWLRGMVPGDEKQRSSRHQASS